MARRDRHVAMNAEAKRGNRCSLSLRVRQPIGEDISLTLYSFMRTGFPVEVEFEYPFRSAHFGFHQPWRPYLVQFSRLTYSSRTYFGHPSLKSGFLTEVESGCPFRNARFEFRRRTRLCYLALFRSAYSGSFPSCSRLPILKMDYSVELAFEYRFQNAHFGFLRRTVL